mmetsp:Transcript_1703/g.2443  ORF Transcript_1703/g.2443 Transcript_1703/m.2443 type:complete len:611 (+) Transcript_1703:87-1919(+)|eukprot:CAMPEP_0184864538 /NCGR_PEP_ID=MMETSP0580-20130426/15317_1 /TAXON_ID=1118495 /ORGANISM="Dactyliosolen fragilissimus" /LENGTH=610 /DNA_ID=CAMNT_0027363383 /DNA_START=63 /DNA_END=1895 /DNA_ORIENTATION=-
MSETSEFYNVQGNMKTGTLKVLFLSSDTGGGHRASAESLARQFELLYPGSTYELLDVMEKDGVHPYNKLVSSYKHLSAHPTQWKVVYSISNSRAFEIFFDVHNKLCEKAIRKSIMAIKPDIVISVHPMMTNVPVVSCSKISEITGRHLPIVTVVTDLGSAHCLWFCNGVDKLFIASDQIRALAKERGKVPDEKIIQIGLPIRHQFAVLAEKLGDRSSEGGRLYQREVRKSLQLPFTDRKTILIMGGGEGVGSLSHLVDALYVELYRKGISALILVVCGRNEKLKNDLDQRNWKEVIDHSESLKENGRRTLSQFSFSSCVDGSSLPSLRIRSGSVGSEVGCMDGTVTSRIRKILSSSSITNENAVISQPTVKDLQEIQENISEQLQEGPNLSIETFEDSTQLRIEETKTETIPVQVDDPPTDDSENFSVDKNASVLNHESNNDNHQDDNDFGSICVVGLGFVTNMADYMVASDILVSKAGPGTIAEAAALSLPVMLTSFLPGQEEGNVDFVVKNDFGSFVSDADPTGVAEEVVAWLSDESKLQHLSRNAKENGAPNAARDIVKSIGDYALKWKEINVGRDRLEKEAENLMKGLASVVSNDGNENDFSPLEA